MEFTLAALAANMLGEHREEFNSADVAGAGFAEEQGFQKRI